LLACVSGVCVLAFFLFIKNQAPHPDFPGFDPVSVIIKDQF
jgi:hypothetical protein